MAISIPEYERKVDITTPKVQMPQPADAIRGAFGENVFQANQNIAETVGKVGELLQKRNKEKYDLDQAELEGKLYAQSDMFEQDLLLNNEDEEVTVNGKKVVRKKGLTQRPLSSAAGIVNEYQEKVERYNNELMSAVQDPETRVRLGNRLLAKTLNTREKVIQYEREQWNKNKANEFGSRIKMAQNNTSLARNFDDVQIQLNNAAIEAQNLNKLLGVDDSTAQVNLKKAALDVMTSAIAGSLVTDKSGQRARSLVKEGGKLFNNEEIGDFNKTIDTAVSENANELEDELNTKFVEGTLTLEDVNSANKPKEMGGIGSTKALKFMKDLNKVQATTVETLSESSDVAKKYVDIVNEVLLNPIESYKAKQILVNAMSDGELSQVEAKNISDIQGNLESQKWGRRTDMFSNAVNSIKSFFGSNDIGNEDLSKALKKLISASSSQTYDPQKEAIDIIKQESIKKNPSLLMHGDDVIKSIIEKDKEETDQKIKDSLSFDFGSLNPFSVSEAQASEGEEGNKEDWKNPYSRLSVGEKILSGSIANKIIDVASGGMSLKEADDMYKAMKESAGKIPEDIFTLSKSIFRILKYDVDRTKSFLSDPISSINSLLEKKSDEEIKNELSMFFQNKDASINILSRVLKPLSRAYYGTLAGAVDKTAEGVMRSYEKRDYDFSVSEALGGAVRGFLSPEDINSLTSRFPFSESERNGSVVELIPRAITEATESLIIMSLSGGTSAVKDIKKVYAEGYLKRAIKNLRENPDSLDDWVNLIASRGGFDKTKIGGNVRLMYDEILNKTEKLIDSNPKVKEALTNYIVKNKSFGRMVLDKLSSETAELRFAPEVGALKSNLKAVANFKLPALVTGEQALRTLLSAGISQDEIQSSGVESYLKTKDKFTRQEVTDYIEGNKVKLEEKVLGEMAFNKNSKYAVPQLLKSAKDAGVDNPDDLLDTIANDGDTYRALTKKFPELEKDEHWAEKVVQDVYGTTTKTGVKFESYQLKGGKNYREVLLTLPATTPKGTPDIKRLGEGKWTIDGRPATREEALSYPTDLDNRFKSSHWDEPNVLVHARINDRVDSEGKKVLFAEEIQSDWHQKGRKEGYSKGDDYPAEYVDSYRKEMQERNKKYVEEPPSDEEVIKYFDLRPLRGGVPDAPFKKTWHELMFKNLLDKAVQGGYDKIAWTTGEQQAERYKLSSKVNQLNWKVSSSGKWIKIDTKERGIIDITTDKNGIVIDAPDIPGATIKGKQLSDVLGKNIADKILAEESGDLVGEGLDLGTKGMKGFYDQILPSFANKYTKKWGGRVGKSVINTGELRTMEEPVNVIKFPGGRRLDVHSLDITPAMKKEILEQGQPMFGNRLAGMDLMSNRGQAGIPSDIPELPDNLDIQKPMILDLLNDSNPSTRPEDFKTAEEYVASKGINLFRGDTSPIELDKYDVEFGLKQGKELGGAMAEGPGIYLTTDMKNAKSYGQNITDTVLDNDAVIVDKQFKKFTKQQIKNILESVDKENLENSLSNWDENQSTAKKLLIDALYDADTAQDQIINIWADVFYHQSPNKFMKLMSDNGVHGLKIDKDGMSHYVIFDRNKLKTKSQLTAEWQAAQGKSEGGVVPPEEPPTAVSPGEEEGSNWEKSADPVNISPDKKTKMSIIDKKLAKIEQIEQRVGAAKEALSYLDPISKSLLNRIKKYSNNKMAEELAGIPKKYITTRETASKPDEIIQELESEYGISLQSENDLVNYLVNLDNQIYRLRQEAKIESVTMRETTQLKESVKDITAGIREGSKLTKDDVKEAQEKVIELLKDANLDLKDKGKFLSTIKNIQTREQLEKAMPQIEERVSKLAEKKIAKKYLGKRRQELAYSIIQKRLEKVDSLRNAMGLPPIKDMKLDQVEAFENELSKYQEGDVFLTQRQLETVENTDLSGIKTLREAREALAKEVGAPVEELSKIKTTEFDRFRYDVALAGQNPFYKLIVDEYHANKIQADLATLDFERELNELTKKARASRKQGISDVLVPTDKLVFEYLSNPTPELADTMTSEEMDLAVFLQDKFSGALEYLMTVKALKTGRENYITNIRRGALEAIKEDGLAAAFRETLDQYKQDEEVFNILDQATGKILPLEKFFQFAMQRKGGIKPTTNVAKAASIYFRTLYTKQALDTFIPKMMIYVDSLTPTKTTPRGLEEDQTLRNFVKEWINSKKGRKARIIAKQGGVIDIATTGLKAFISIMDLGLNIPAGIAANVGESAASYVALGNKQTALGIARFATKQGQNIVKKYEGFVGRTVWDELSEPSKNIGDKFATTLFGLFNSSNTRANKIGLLGSMTEAEFNAGEISNDRLLDVRMMLGRFRVQPGMKSILENTTEGSILTHYKSWAIPILSTVSSDLVRIGKGISKGEFSRKEAVELTRALTATLAALALGSMYSDDNKDKGFVAQLIRKVRREALTILGALDPKMWLGTPRLQTWLADLGTAINQLIILEKYKSKAEKYKGKLKGVESLKRLTIPRAFKQFGNDKKKKKSTGVSFYGD